MLKKSKVMPRSKKYYQESSKKWKDKYAEKQYAIKLLKLEKRDLQRSREKWKSDCKALKEELDTKKKAKR